MKGRSAPHVAPCEPDDRQEALTLLYRRVPDSLRPGLVAHALHEAERGEVDLSGLWVASRHGAIAGALLTQPLAGRAAAVWAPEVDVVWGRGATAEALVRAALESLRGRGFRVAQALLDESSPREAAQDLTAGGMPHVTDLHYLECDAHRPILLRPGVPGVAWACFGPDTEADFRAGLTLSYVGSLDMPELDGLRSLDDILASHRASGRFEPTRWLVGSVSGEPEARVVMLLSEVIDRDAWEVAYLGLSPAARGRGIGRAALAKAVELARFHATRLELAVDTRNQPAQRLYRDAGFLVYDRRAVHIAMLG